MGLQRETIKETTAIATAKTESSIAARDSTSFCYSTYCLLITPGFTAHLWFPSFKTHTSTITFSFTLGSKFPAMLTLCTTG